MRIRVRDVELFFDVEGATLVPQGPAMLQRPTVVALHGGPGTDHASLRPELSGLAAIAQVVFLDQRGHGRSDRSRPQSWTMENWADDLFEFCQALGIDKPVVFGVSFGGTVALHYAARHPEHPAKLILDSTAAYEDVERSCRTFERLGSLEVAAAARAFLTAPSPETASEYRRLCLPLYLRQRSPAQMGEASARSIHNPEITAHWAATRHLAPDLRPHLAKISCPTLILIGNDDPMATVEGAEELASLIPAGLATIVRFESTGHNVVREQPERALEVIAEFLAN